MSTNKFGDKKKSFLGMRDIARVAGVSIATVSRVLNNPETTSEKMRKKVMKVVDEYDYVPNSSARAIFTGSSKSIALFAEDIANPFFTKFIKYFNNIAIEHDYTLLICDIENNEEIEKRFLHYCKGSRTSAIILTSGKYRETLISNEKYQNIPVVLLDREFFKDIAGFQVMSDHKKGIGLLTDYLFNLNHRKIGYMTGPMEYYPARTRYAAFMESMQSLGLEVLPHYIKKTDYTVESGVEAFDYFYSMKDAPTAIICGNDQNARGFILRAYDLGVKIPDEFSVCGYDGVDPEAFFPAITSIRQDTEQIAKVIFEFIASGEELEENRTTVVDVAMSIGTTCKKLSV
ncbi:MAG: LacI family DNA-binding transcriptional regulator [Christensenellaceae bacterium]|jgi:LacI family repressor for deo operon, udp, cdd, tsx, nupC, and nupG